MSKKKRPEPIEPEIPKPVEADVEDPIGDETDGEARAAIAPQAAAEIKTGEETGQSESESDLEARDDSTAEEETEPGPRPAAKLERLQKILAQSGVASRRKAEEMIEQGRVQVNGKIVTVPGTKADAGRDHIRVDGKLLHGAERQRYFVLNKPKGYVTTVKDPEGRPTVMQFFEKMRERLYPVGRLDYMSEGLLLVTNDGELANKLTRASAGVEKTYLVKVAGVPTEDELETLRAGVAIEKGKPGSEKVRTSPARIRQVRQGDNPWYEVVLIEGRNRELRKMFEEIGHFVEKIRRVGYGPLILDQEPGNMRELDAQELEQLRKAADGKLRTPKAKDVRRQNRIDSLGTQKSAFRDGRGGTPVRRDGPPKRRFEGDARGREERGPAKFGRGPSAAGPAGRDSWKKKEGWKKEDGGERPAAKKFGPRPVEARPAGSRSPGSRPYSERPATGRALPPRPSGERPFGDRPGAGRSFPPKPAWKQGESRPKPEFKRPFTPRPPAPRPPADDFEERGPKRPSRLQIEPIQGFERAERPQVNRTGPDRARPYRAAQDRPAQGRPPADRHRQDRPSPGRPSFDRSGGARSEGARPQGERPSGVRPFRSQGGLARPFTTSTGKPRAGGARPSSKPGSQREGFRPRSEEARPERRTGTGWKPKPAFGGKGKPAGRPGAKSGGFSKGGPKGASTRPGGKRTGPRPGGKRPGSGGKRG
ncbi:MAG: pseudouridine synthase [Terracidiphilus sp.]